MTRYTKAPSRGRRGSGPAPLSRTVLGILLIPMVVACGGGDSGGNGTVEPPDPPRAVAIAISPESASLTFIGQTATFTASITDQHGASFSGTVTWSSDEPGVFTVNPQGVVTSVANGTGTLRAAFQNLSATATVTVSQLATAVEAASGDGQSGFTDDELPEPVVVRVTDEGGAPVAGVTVSFEPGQGHGSVDPGSVETDAAGEASAVWTLGSDTGDQTLAAAVAGGLEATFTASAIVAVCDRTSEVRDAIVRQAGGADCQAVEAHHLASITELDLSGDPAGGSNAGAASSMRSPLTALREGDFAGLSNLERLDLSNNRLSELPATVFDGLGSLATLALGGNGLAGIPAGLFDGLSGLRSLGIERNRLTDLPDGALAGVVGIEWVNLDDNLLSDLPGGVFSGATELSFLSLAGNRLTRLPAGVFDGPVRLEWLNLNGNLLADFPGGIFSEIAGLRFLWLADNRLARLPERAFAGLSDLESLRLDGNPGAPFAFTMTLEHAGDSTANPAAIVARVAEGAPFATQAPLTAVGASLSTNAAAVGAGAILSDTISVTITDEDAGGRVEMHAAPSAPDPNATCSAQDIGHVPGRWPCWQGVRTAAGRPLLFGNGGYTGTVAVASEEASAPEGGVIRVEVAVDPAPESALQVRYTIGPDADTATADADEADHTGGTGGVVEIPAGTTTGTIEIAINDDDDIEPPREVLVVSLEGGSGYRPGEVSTIAAEIKEGICDRTPAVQRAIGSFSSRRCDEVDSRWLASITNCHVHNLPSLKQGDFLGLVNLGALTITTGAITELPAGVLSDLPSLVKLDVVGTDLAKLPPALELPTLREISFRGNQLTELPEGLFSRSPELRVVSLGRYTDAGRGSPIAKLPEKLFANNPRLEWIQINYTALTELPPGLFSGLTALEFLQILGNHALRGLPSGVFSSLSALQTVVINGNPLLAELPPNVFSGLSALETVVIVHNPRLTTLPPGVFSGLPNLRYAHLYYGISGGGGLTEVPPDAFSGSSALERILLRGHQLAQLPPELFSGLSALRELDIADNALTELPPRVFSGLSSLERLAMYENPLTELPPGLFAGLTSLRFLNIWRFRMDLPFSIKLPDSIFTGLVGLENVTLPSGSVPVELKRNSDSVVVEIRAGAPGLTGVRLAVRGATLAATWIGESEAHGSIYQVDVRSGRIHSRAVAVTLTGSAALVHLPEYPGNPFFSSRACEDCFRSSYDSIFFDASSSAGVGATGAAAARPAASLRDQESLGDTVAGSSQWKSVAWPSVRPRSAADAFALPLRAGWADTVASITLSRPDGSATLNDQTDRPMAILRKPLTGQVRGGLRDVPMPSRTQAEGTPVAATIAPALGSEVLLPGIPDAAAGRHLPRPREPAPPIGEVKTELHPARNQRHRP